MFRSNCSLQKYLDYFHHHYLNVLYKMNMYDKLDLHSFTLFVIFQARSG